MNGDGSPLMTKARNERDGRPLIDNLPINGLCPLQACQHPHNNEELLSLSCTCGLCGDGMVIDASPATECSNDNEVLSLGNAIQQKIDKHSHCFSGRRQKFIKTKHHLIGACVKAGVRYDPPNIDKKSGETKKRRRQLSRSCEQCDQSNATEKTPSPSVRLESEIEKYSHLFKKRRPQFLRSEYQLIEECLKTGVSYKPPVAKEKKQKQRRDAVSCHKFASGMRQSVYGTLPIWHLAMLLNIKSSLKLNIKNLETEKAS